MSLATAPADSLTYEVDDRDVLTARRAPNSSRAWRLFLTANIVALLAASFLLRVWQLGNIPGVNGDEAEYAVRAIRLLRGESIVWRTPTGNAMNPFFFFPQVAIHAVLAPSFVTLRLIALASGLTALVLNYLLCRQLFGVAVATVSTLLLAALPIDIAYSRFAWDTCQTLAASTLVVYPALLMLAQPQRRWRWFALACVGYAVAYVVHPTNVFLGGFLVAVPIVERRQQWQAVLRRFGPWKCGLAALAGILLAGFVSWFGRDVLGIGSVEAASPAGVAEFARNYGRLFNGTTIYRYIAGSHGAETIVGPHWPYDFGWLDLLTLVVFAGAIVVLSRELGRTNSAVDGGVLLGWFVTTSGFLLVAGPEALRPHWERYGLCLLLPGALLVSRASVVGLRSGTAGRTVAISMLAIAWLLLADFQASYFAFIHRTGGESQQTFRSAAIEPKLAAFDLILSRHQADVPTQIVASEWWNYWPLAYLASPYAEIAVVWQPEEANVATARCYVDFAGSKEHAQHRRMLVEQYGAAREQSILDYAGRPTLVLLEPEGNSAATNKPGSRRLDMP